MKNQRGESEGTSIFTIAGMFLAGYMSWLKWHSVGWLILNGIFGWLYVIYHVFRYGIPASF